MDKYNGLLSTVAKQYDIPKGKQESEDDWKTRLVYSICGLMAYASLWDNTDIDNSISIIHLKRRIHKIFVSYQSMYPEISLILPNESKKLEEEITSQFLNCGIVYHSPNRIVPSMKREESFNGILFQRGISLDSISTVSGIGLYSQSTKKDTLGNVKSMFGLEQDNLQSFWQKILSHVSWKSEPSLEELSGEYLNMLPYSNHKHRKYWGDTPDKTGITSILRTGQEGAQLYYLYRYNNSQLEVSPLANWQIEDGDYRRFTCACLSSHGSLPPIEFFRDGSLVYLNLNYLLPPRELEFLKLYSWPGRCNELPSNFNRKISFDVFTAIKNILSDEGYEFKEIKTYAEWSKFHT